VTHGYTKPLGYTTQVRNAGGPTPGPYPRDRTEEVPDRDAQFTPEWLDRTLTNLTKAIEAISQSFVDQTNRVDEYRPQSLTGESLTIEIGQPDYECDEIITAVIITGPTDTDLTGTAAITAGVGTYTATLPVGASLAGFTVSTGAGAGATATSVVVAGFIGGPFSYEYASPAASVPPLNEAFAVPLQPLPGQQITVTFNGATNTGAGYINAFGACGPVQMQLGRRVWNLQLPPTGILVIAPIQLKLDRNSTRELTSATAGDWAFELMGYADTGRRGRI
jgi:hypothetical protein